MQKQWDALVEGARAEGSVQVILSGEMPQTLQPVLSEFEKKFGVKVESQTGAGQEHADRITAEQQAGRFTVDVWIGGANTALAQLLPANALAPVKPMLILPEVTDQSLWYGGRHAWSDPEGQYIFTWGASPAVSDIVYNTNLVDPNTITSYWDLLDPKWHGEIVGRDPSQTGVAAETVYYYLAPELGPEFLSRLIRETDITITADARQAAEWIATGKFALGLFALATPIDELKNEGFPVESVLPHPLKEVPPLSASAANLFAPRNAPHPNAQTLFINWMLSREGQSLIIKQVHGVADIDSLRTDIPKEDVAQQYRIDPSVSYLVPFLSPDYQTRQKEALDFIRNELVAAGKK